jgi:VCBS repeat-containing protein
VGNNIFNNNQFGNLTYSVFTNSALRFTNGKDPQTYTAVQQSDIDNAANSLEQANTPSPQQIIQPLVHANERLVGTPTCNPSVTSDHKVGDKATTVTVSVSFTCTGEAYDYDGALAMASQLLTNQASSQLGSGYVAAGNIKTTLTSATLTNAKSGTVTLLVDAEGVWAYQFTSEQKQALARLIAGKTKSEALSLLALQTGVGQVVITLASGDTLPVDASKITIMIQNASG